MMTKQAIGELDRMRTSAILDPSEQYRYRLVREWEETLPRVCFVMLNPSTADATVNDPTIRRCLGFAKQWGYGSLEVVNLFAYRSPKPVLLRRVHDPVGPENDRHIREAVQNALLVVAAWGAEGKLFRRDRTVMSFLSAPHCLGVTGAGAPRHPLYLSADTVPVVYSGRPVNTVTLRERLDGPRQDAEER